MSSLSPLVPCARLPRARTWGVLATLALWVAAVSMSLRDPCDCPSAADVAREVVTKFALEAFPRWATQPAHAGRCPTLDDLAPCANNNMTDPWGNRYRLRCHDLPRGATGIAVWSLGPDGRDDHGEGDDLASWRLP